MAEIKSQNWFRRHWIISIFLGLILLVIFNNVLFGMFGKDNQNTDLTGNVVNQQTNENSGNIVDEQIPIEEILLKVTDLTCEYGEYDWIYVKGRIKNEGNIKADYVKANIDLYNNDKWVDSDFTFIRNMDLSAGATDSFEKTWTDDKMILTKCEVFAISDESKSQAVTSSVIPKTETIQETTPTTSETGDWHELTTFNGVNWETTDVFNIKGSKFRMTYTTNPGEYPEYAAFSFFVYPEGETTMYTESIMTNMGTSGTDSSISYAGAGNYYLKVIAANLDSWNIKIEEYY